MWTIILHSSVVQEREVDIQVIFISTFFHFDVVNIYVYIYASVG